MIYLTDYRSSVRLQEFSQITEALSEYVSLRLRELCQITGTLSDYRSSLRLQKLSQFTEALSGHRSSLWDTGARSDCTRCRCSAVRVTEHYQALCCTMAFRFPWLLFELASNDAVSRPSRPLTFLHLSVQLPRHLLDPIFNLYCNQVTTDHHHHHHHH